MKVLATDEANEQLERVVSDRHRRLMLVLAIAYQIAVLCLVSYVVARYYWQWTPVGAAGQPRATPLSADWLIPWQLALVLSSLVALQCFAPKVPGIGIGIYCCISFAFQVHSEEWIFVRAIWLLPLIALTTLAAALIDARRRHGLSVASIADCVSLTLLAFAVWCLIVSAIAAASGNGFQPALQFHPIQVVELMALFLCVRVTDQRSNVMTLIAVTLASTLAVRILVNGVTYRDAGIASDVALAIPLVGYLANRSRRWLTGIAWTAVAVAGLAVLYHVENRGAIVGIAAGGIVALGTVRHRVWVLACILPMLIAMAWMLSESSLGRRFASIGHLQSVLQSDQRIQIWRAGIEIAKDNPVCGIGPGNFVNEVGRYDVEIANHSAHNLFVDILAETGLTGMVLFLLLMTMVVRSCLRLVHLRGVEGRTEGWVEGRWVLVSQAVWVGCGMFLSTTLFTLPYVLMAIVATSGKTKRKLTDQSIV